MPAYARKLLFVCSRNRIRSLTAEKLYAGFPGYEVRSAGTQPDARIKVTAGLLGWADLIFFMEKSHLNRVRQKFPDALDGKDCVVLGIPDEFTFMEPALLDELSARLAEHVEVPSL
ncbi:MAG: protein tyrosine phosphatase [Verrucomicrobia bacterium Tous-C9LFEB]|nr:MAG: protein tyrosine phosphatase [Verrucomicrobia bacterium Tous-C9LFEB]